MFFCGNAFLFKGKGLSHLRMKAHSKTWDILLFVFFLFNFILVPAKASVFSCSEILNKFTGPTEFHFSIDEKGKHKLSFFADSHLGGRVLNRVAQMASIPLGITGLASAIGKAEKSDGTVVSPPDVMKALGITFELSKEDEKKFLSGPAVYATNHPIMGADLLAVASAADKHGKGKVKIVMTSVLRNVEPYKDIGIFVYLAHEEGSINFNKKAIREMLKWLKDGNQIVISPGVHGKWDEQWLPTIVKLAKAVSVPIVPAFVDAALPWYSSMPGGSLMQVWSIRHLRGRAIPLKVGEAFLPEQLQEFPSNEEAIEAIRKATYRLGEPSLEKTATKKGLVRDVKVGVNMDGKFSLQVYKPNSPSAKRVNQLIRSALYYAGGLGGVTRKLGEVKKSDRLPANGLFDALGLKYEITDADKSKFVKKGPAIYVSNHPLMGPDLLAIAAAANEHGSGSSKIIVGDHFSGVEPIQGASIFVTMAGKENSSVNNRKGVADMLKWLQNGNSLVISPGVIGNWDKEWLPAVVGMAKRKGASIVPVFIDVNRPWYAKTPLREVMEGWELLSMPRRPIKLRVGPTFTPEELTQFVTEDAAIDHIRKTTYRLGDPTFETKENIGSGGKPVSSGELQSAME